MAKGEFMTMWGPSITTSRVVLVLALIFFIGQINCKKSASNDQRESSEGAQQEQGDSAQQEHEELKGRLQELSDEAHADWKTLATQLERYQKPIPELVEIMRAFTSEEEAFAAVNEAREELEGASGAAEAAVAYDQLNAALSRLWELSRSYPALKNQMSFVNLRDELETTKTRIEKEKRRYNEMVLRYEKTAKEAPSAIVDDIEAFRLPE